MTTFLLVLQIILSVLIVIVVLLQKSSSIGLGAYSGSNESLFGARGPASFLAKLTMTLGVIFLVNTIALSYLYNTRGSQNKSVIDNVEIPKSAPLLPSSVPLSSPLLNNTQNTGQNPLLTPSQGNSPLLAPQNSTPDSTQNTQNTESSPQNPQK